MSFFLLVIACGLGCGRAQRERDTALGAPDGDAAAGTATTNAGVPSLGTSPDGRPLDGVPLYAFALQAPIFNAAEWPPKDPSKAEEGRQGVVRLGYLRMGEQVVAKREVVAKANCAEGWHELVTGGFVCGRFATTDAQRKELKFAPHPPYLDRNLPFQYGLNLTPGTPLYRRIPLKSERRENEKTLALGKGKTPSDIVKKIEASGEVVPAYLKDTGAAKSTLSFDDLKGESDLVAQRMLKGFYLSIDRKVDAQSGVLWHTMSGFFVPKDHLILHEPKTEFEGVVLESGSESRIKSGADGGVTGQPSSNSQEARHLPLAFVIGTKARQCQLDPDGKRARRMDKIDRFSILGLTGKRQTVDDRVYFETTQGFWVRDIDVAVVSVPKVPSDVAKGERWVDVDLGAQALVAFEGDKPVYATIVSTGRHSPDPAKDHPTVEGSFRIREKHVSTTMDDDGASDGTYRIEDVPWVMYFEKSFALHGAFWHSSFGRERSHGCVNLTPHDARHIFGWAGPSLPEGWHGVRATKENPGTRIVVHK